MAEVAYDPALDPPRERLLAELAAQARAIAWKHWHKAPEVLELDELVSLAHVGLAQSAASWDAYCAARGFDPRVTRFYAERCRRRMRGSILDYLRSLDYVSRTVRTRARAIREAGQDLGRSEAELAAGAGLSRRQVSETLAAMARRPVGLDLAVHDVADAGDTEGQAATSGLLGAAVAAMRALPLEHQLLLALTYYGGAPLREAAAALGMDQEQAAAAQAGGVQSVHAALAAAAGEG